MRGATGNTTGALADFAEAALAPTPERLLRLAHMKCVADQFTEAIEVAQRAVKAGLDPATLRPSDRPRLELLTKRLGMTIR